MEVFNVVHNQKIISAKTGIVSIDITNEKETKS